MFPTFGNHESVPVNSFPPPFITGSQSLDWLLDPTMQLWGHWLSKLPEWTQAQQTIMRYIQTSSKFLLCTLILCIITEEDSTMWRCCLGYVSSHFKLTSATMKTSESLSLYKTVCVKDASLSHSWLLINSTDPGGQLQWLVEQLSKAEQAGDKVHILGHIPPGSGDCLKVWSGLYHKIVNRYTHTYCGNSAYH